MNTPTPRTHDATRLQSHVSIDTDDLARSSAFYRALFGAEPVLAKPDYARFWPAELGLVLGLNVRPRSARGSGRLRHLGVLFPDADALQGVRARLAAAGFETSGAEHVECCYGELDQYWATDPSGVQWELFLAHREEVESPARSTSSSGRATACCAPSCCS